MSTMPLTSAPALPLSRLRRVTEYIQEHLDQNLSLAELSAVVYMSPYHFARLFRDRTGVPPHRFIVRNRIDRASLLLVSGELPVSQIARMVGFRSASHFTTVFHRMTGRTPRAYRAGGTTASPACREGARDALR